MLKIKKEFKKILSIFIVSAMIFIDFVPLSVDAASIVIADSLANTTVRATPTNTADNDPTGLRNKQQGPTVDVSFGSEGAMRQGSRMTATAVPGFFNNASDPTKLYFTWYLKRPGCEKDAAVTDSNRDKCDLDNNDKIDENDWKIAAAKIIMAGTFDSEGADYSKFSNSQDESSAGYKAIPSPLSEWEINSGEDENDEDAPNCYVQEPESGLVYEMRRVTPLFEACPNDAAGNEYELACVSDQKAACDVLNPEYTQQNIDVRQVEIDAAIAWNANPANVNNQVPVPAQIAKTISNDFDACAVSNTSQDNLSCSITEIENFKTELSCDGSDEIPMCVRTSGYTAFPIDASDPNDTDNPLLGIIFGNSIINSTDGSVKEKVCSSIAEPNELGGIFSAPPDFLDNSQPAISSANEKCSVIKDKLIKGTKDGVGNTAIVGNNALEPFCGFKKDDNMCKHLFPHVPGEVTGDGKFTLTEKSFWEADPSKASTNGNAKDEEVAVGLGVDKFTWIFSPGDMVGVVVEGESTFPSEHSLSSEYKRMWAFSDNKCEALEELDDMKTMDGNENKNRRGFYVEGADAAKTGFLTAEVDLNDCLEENLLEPDAGSESKLTVQVNATPANPINDPNGRGDILNVSSGATNTENPAGLLYTWSVQKSRDGSSAPIDTTGWQDITTGMKNGGSFSESDLSGLGKKNLAINLNMQESLIANGMNTGSYDGGVFYLRIKVKIKGSAADGSQDAEGMTSPPIRVLQQQNEIRVYPVAANNSGMLSMNNSSSATPFCSDQAGKTICYVTKNEIIGITIPRNSNSSETAFSWTINGNAYECKSSISSQCSDGNTLFFPILGNEGEAVDVVAKGIDKNGESIEISRHFVIIPPQVRIVPMSVNTAWPKLLGYYKDLDNNRYPDYSTQVLETNAGSTVTLGAAFYPAWKAGQAGFDWAIDGQVLPENHNLNQIKLAIDKSSGESYNVGLVALYSPGSNDQVNNIRKALLKNWGISPEDVIEQNDSANIQINVVDGTSDTVAAAENSSLSASLITHLPEQLIFLFKLSLTSVLLLLMTGLLFAFIPETLFREEK